MLPQNDPIQRVRQWAKQTIAFAVSVENAPKTGLPKEVLEQGIITAHAVENRLFGEAIAACGDNGNNVDFVLVELANRILDWVAKKRASRPSQID